MPKRVDIKSILIIGSGPIVIGQACEFDYAGTQACKALKDEGYRIILINSNPATIMTDAAFADATYIEPITEASLEKIIAKEKPDALLPTLGGQTALNCTLALSKAGILQKYNIEIIGASIQAIEVAENRNLFQELMKSIGLSVPHTTKVKHLEEAKSLLSKINLPVIIRPSFALGGNGAGIAETPEAFLNLCETAFAAAPCQEVMVDEALIGWKEFELEVIRDKKDNCIIVCGIENLDPLGIHTGDSITVAPIQTLTDKEYQTMRHAAFAVLRAVGVDTGGSNVQFAVHPQTGKMVVIEMNPRVSRSSALVSKASGYPIAKIAAKLAVGYTLNELQNDITGNQLPASFEPSLDYVVVKFPRFNFDKFPDTTVTRGPQMRSVGEVMAIGRTFEEALQKAMRSLEIGQDGFGNLYSQLNDAVLRKIIIESGPLQLWAIGEAFRRHTSVFEMYQLTHIDPWFLEKINDLIKIENTMLTKSMNDLTPQLLKKYKKCGFADSRIATLLKCSTEEITALRKQWKINPVYKHIDSCAGEFSTPTAYLYSTYEDFCESAPTSNKKMLIIGSGPNRIGQGIEFDYCCVQAAKALHHAGYETILVNCNPETVSTDYDIVDRLYCTPLTLEEVLEIISLEKPIGVFAQYGGQTPLQLAAGLAKTGIKLIGMDIASVQQTEDRYQFQQLLQQLELNQPKNHCVYNLRAGIKATNDIAFPVIVRPSFVIGGAAMAVANNTQQLTHQLKKVFTLHKEQPVLLEEFLQDAIEVDIDAITDGENVLILGLLEHIEAAGVHSGDSACITPPVHLTTDIQTKIKQQVYQIATHLKLQGVFNVQLAVQDKEIFIIEVNPRASRTLPFLCKATGLPLVEIATRCALGESLNNQGITAMPNLPYYCVKESVLPFGKFLGSVALGPEMKSTGEVMGIGNTPQEAYAKAQFAAGNPLPKSGYACIIAADFIKVSLAKILIRHGFKIITSLKDVSRDNCSLIIAINDGLDSQSRVKEALRYAIDNGICHTSTIHGAKALIDALEFYLTEAISISSLQERYQQIKCASNIAHHPTHLLTGEELTPQQIHHILAKALELKRERSSLKPRTDLQGCHLALLFDKPSLRTRFSFTIAMHELGGDVVESIENTRKQETPEDQACVLNGYCHAIMIRTFQDNVLEKMSRVAKIPIINGLSDLHHPCQILADLLTLNEIFGQLQGVTLCYVGDGNNILHSLLLMAPQMGVTIHYACPQNRGPNEAILQKSLARLNPNTGKIRSFTQPLEAVKHANAVYTDVWTSMGFEAHSEEHLFSNFQVNEHLMQNALPNAVFMHCLPMVRGKEVSETLPDQSCSVIFQQSENRLHVQKALLLSLMGKQV